MIGLQIPEPQEAPTFSAPEPTKPFEIPWQTLFLTLYALGGLASLTPSIHSWVKLRRLKQSAIRCTDRRIQTFAGKDSIRVYLSDRTSMPMAWGFFRPIILLPKNANVWTDARLKAVLAHEQAHIERRDTRMTILLQLTRALYWPQPLVWWLASEWQTTAELDCDRRALEQGENAHDYATALYDFAKQHSKPNPLALPMARPHAIEERVKRVLSPSMNASQSGIISTLVALSLFFAASVVAIEEGKHRARNSATNKLIITKLSN